MYFVKYTITKFFLLKVNPLERFANQKNCIFLRE